MNSGGSALTAPCRPVPHAIVQGGKGARGLVRGLGYRAGARCGGRTRVGRGRGGGRGAGLEAIGHGAPRLQHLSPEGGDRGVEVGEVAVGEEEGRGVVGKGGVGNSNPVEGKTAVGVGAGLK